MQFDREKLKAAIIYTCRHCEPEHLGAVKLHKVLYFADMLRYIQTGRSISGSTYRKSPLGPTNDQLLPALRDLSGAGLLKVDVVDYFGYRKSQYTAIGDSNVILPADDLAVLDEVIDFVCHHNTAKTISEFSHQSAWELAEFGEELPYTSAFRLIPTQVSEESMQWASEQEALIEGERHSRDLAVVPFRTFRSRVLERMGRE